MALKHLCLWKARYCTFGPLTLRCLILWKIVRWMVIFPEMFHAVLKCLVFACLCVHILCCCFSCWFFLFILFLFFVFQLPKSQGWLLWQHYSVSCFHLKFHQIDLEMRLLPCGVHHTEAQAVTTMKRCVYLYSALCSTDQWNLAYVSWFIH